MMTLIKAERIDSSLIKLTYELSHSTPGRDGTTLKALVEVQYIPGGQNITVKLESLKCDGPSVKDSLDRLASWLKRLTEALETRQEVSIPL